MISIVWQGDHRYNVYQSGEDIGCITVSDNPFHNTHHYLNLGLTRYDPSIAKELFSHLRKELGQPLHIMLYSKPECTISRLPVVLSVSAGDTNLRLLPLI